MARPITTILAVVLSLVGIRTASVCQAANGQLELAIVDDATGEPIAARVHLFDSKDRTRRPRRTIAWNDHFVVDGHAVLELPPGLFHFIIERGHEYRNVTGHFHMRTAASDNKTVRLKRVVDMTEHGWWSGDLEMYRPEIDADALLRSEELHIAPLMAWKLPPDSGSAKKGKLNSSRNRFVDSGAGYDARSDGQVSLFGLSQPLTKVGSSLMDTIKATRRADGHVNVARPNSWDLPIWLASQQVDSFAVLDGSIWREGHPKKPPAGRLGDPDFYPSPHGLGHWYTDTYFNILNAGFRIPPTAGSGSGKSPNPVGYNRTYVHCGETCTYESWWENLRAGRVMITNGPLLIPRVNGQLPGHVFRGYDGEALKLSITLQLHTRERIDYLEVLKNGEVAAEVRLDRATPNSSIPAVEFAEAGWMAIRAVTKANEYRHALTGPFYVEFPGQPRRISRRAAEFFLEWTHQAADREDLPEGQERDAIMRYHRAAQRYWQQQVGRSNAE